jgi:ApbE superfamily uncharacterized protein (UPF0280 family)
MQEYKDRTYRKHFRHDRWKGFVVKYKETDVWVGIHKNSFHADMPDFTGKIIRKLRSMMDTYLNRDPQYAEALLPYHAQENAPKIIQQMSEISCKTGIGPMSAVAGAFAFHIADQLKKHFDIQEIVVENGGDIYADIKEGMDISIFAGSSPLSERVGLHIEAAESPLGICTSSGTVGPSLSFGKADAVMIVCQDVLLADSYATVFANQIQTSNDINHVLEKIRSKKEIISALLIKDDKMGITGKFKMKLLYP